MALQVRRHIALENKNSNLGKKAAAAAVTTGGAGDESGTSGDSTGDGTKMKALVAAAVASKEAEAIPPPVSKSDIPVTVQALESIVRLVHLNKGGSLLKAYDSFLAGPSNWFKWRVTPGFGYLAKIFDTATYGGLEMPEQASEWYNHVTLLAACPDQKTFQSQTSEAAPLSSTSPSPSSSASTSRRRRRRLLHRDVARIAKTRSSRGIFDLFKGKSKEAGKLTTTTAPVVAPAKPATKCVWNTVKAECEPNNLCDFVAPQSAMDESAFGDNSSSSDSGGSSGSSDLTSSANCKAMATEQSYDDGTEGGSKEGSEENSEAADASTTLEVPAARARSGVPPKMLDCGYRTVVEIKENVKTNNKVQGAHRGPYFLCSTGMWEDSAGGNSESRSACHDAYPETAEESCPPLPVKICR